MEAVNLLPLENRGKQKSSIAAVGGGLPAKRTLQVGGAIAAGLAVLFGALYIYERSVVHDKRTDLATTQARVVAVQSQVEGVKTAQAESAQRLAVVQSVSATRMNWDRAMNDLARVLPVDVYLTNLSASAPTPAAAVGSAPAPTTDTTAATPAVASTLTISGVAPSNVRVGTVLDRLSLLPWMTNVALQTSSRQGSGPASFSITAGVTEEH